MAAEPTAVHDEQAAYDDGSAAYARADYATALRLWRPLAEQGFAPAQTNLGVMYAMGQGVPQNYAEALKWYRKAADQGNADAQRNLGSMYAMGQGVPQDDVEAYKWFTLATLSAEVRENAARGRAIVAARMTPAQIAEGERLAKEWKPTQ